jgi:zinc protease
MQKATPLILVLVLAVTAGILSVRSHKPPTAVPPAVVETAPVAAPPVSLPTVKTDTAAPKVTPRPWPQASSDVAPDSGATFGTLENGMRYIIYPNVEPPCRS